MRRLRIALIFTLAATAGAQAPRTSLLITPAWLAEHAKDPNLVLLHVGDKAEYEKSHIAGARLISTQDVSVSSADRETGLLLEMPTVDSLRIMLERLGISDNSHVVVYYGGDWVPQTTRIMLALDYAGFGARSSVLDGGMGAWKESGLSVTADASRPVVSGKVSPLKVNPVVTDAAYVQAHLNDPAFHLIDARAKVFFDGVQQGRAPSRNGHVAGARSIPFTDVSDEKSRFKPVGELAKLFENAGIGPRDTVVAYCHIGQQATAVLFAARMLGHPVLLYDASFQEWGRRVDLPIENPSEKKP